jgi:NAD(P)H-dependent FMN reductase
VTDLFIPVVLGTARPGRRSATVASRFVDLLKERDAMTELVDVAAYGLTGTGVAGHGRDLAHYHELVAAADGFVIVAPEYNHGYPGELKLLLDSEYAAYVRKPVGLVSVSTGLVGGARMTEQLRLVVTALRMIPVSPAVHVTEVEEALDRQGRFAAPSLEAVAGEMLDEVEWYASAMRATRIGRS